MGPAKIGKKKAPKSPLKTRKRMKVKSPTPEPVPEPQVDGAQDVEEAAGGEEGEVADGAAAVDGAGAVAGGGAGDEPDPEELEPEDGASDKPDKGKGKGKSQPAERRSYTLTDPQEEALVEWIQAKDGIWRRGSSQYKTRKHLWEAKAEEMGVTVKHLEGWWKSQKDWYVRLNNKKSGQAAKQYTDREQWVLRKLAFYSGQVKSQQEESQPLSHLSRREPRRDLPLMDSDDSDAGKTLDHRQPSSSQVPSTSQVQDLVGMEAEAARTESSSQQSRSRRRRRDESQEEAWMQELRDSIRANTEMLGRMVSSRPNPNPEREFFIQYVCDSMRNMPEDRYKEFVPWITQMIQAPACRQTPPPPPPRQSQCAPSLQMDYQLQHQLQPGSQLRTQHMGGDNNMPVRLLQSSPYSMQFDGQQGQIRSSPDRYPFSNLLRSTNDVLNTSDMGMNLSQVSMDSLFSMGSHHSKPSREPSLNTPPLTGRPPPATTISRRPPSPPVTSAAVTTAPATTTSTLFETVLHIPDVESIVD